MKSVTVDLAVYTVSFLLLMQLSTCDRYMSDNSGVPIDSGNQSRCSCGKTLLFQSVESGSIIGHVNVLCP